MTSTKFGPMPRGRRLRRQLPAVAVLTAAMLLSGCSANTAAPAPATAGAASGPGTPSVSPTAAGAASAVASAGPTAETAKKELVDGFPSTLIPLMKGAEVQASSLQRSTPVSVASLTATVTATPDAVLSYYSKVYTGQKFTALPGDSVDGVPTKTFVRASGKESVVVGVVQTGATATVTIGANVFPASLK